MKQYALHVTTDFPVVGTHVGYLAIDAPSGGYPWNRQDRPELFTTMHECKHEITDVLNATKSLREGSDGGFYISGTATSFFEAYRKVTGRGRYAEVDLVFEVLEIDFTNPKKITTEVLRRVELTCREAENWKTREQAYYRVKEVDLS